MAKVLCVLYDDPVDGYPRSYAREGIPKIERYFDGQTTPTPQAIDFTPGELLGCVSGALGLRAFLEDAGHTLVVTSDKDGADSEFERNLPDEILDRHSAIAELAAFPVRLGDLRLDRNDSGEAWAEFVHAWISSNSISNPTSRSRAAANTRAAAARS